LLNVDMPWDRWKSSVTDGGWGGEDSRWRSCVSVMLRARCIKKGC
jgi:hypothetical protein